MRFTLIFFFAFIQFVLNAQTPAWTRINPSPQGMTINDIHHVPGSNRLVAACSGSTVLISDNLGETWYTMLYPGGLPSNFDALGVKFLNYQVGFLYGSTCNLLKTYDGGQTWHVKYSTPYYYDLLLNDMEFINDSVGFAVGPMSVVLRTTDRGETWERMETGTYISMKNIDFRNSTDGYITSNEAGMVRTTDGGNSWIALPNPAGIPSVDVVNDIYFTSPSTGFAVTMNGIYKSTDGGLNWSQVYTDATGLNAARFSFVNSQKGIAFQASTYSEPSKVIITTDGGNIWHLQEQASEICCKCLSWFNESLLFSGGSYGCFWKSEDGGYNWQEMSQNALNGIILDAIVFDENNGVILESDENQLTSIIRTADGFHSFDTLLTLNDLDPSIDFPTPDSGYCVAQTVASTQLEVFRTTNGGESWNMTVIPLEINMPESDEPIIDFYNGTRGVIIASDRLYFSYDGGVTWIEHYITDNLYLHRVVYVTPTKIVCSGNSWEYGYFTLITENNGENWSIVTNPTFWVPNLYFYDEMRGFGLYGYRIFRTLNGGYSWYNTYMTGGNISEFRDITFSSADTGYAVGRDERENVLKTTDGGTFWSPVHAPIAAEINNVDFVDNETGYIFGVSDIFKTTTGGIVSVRSPKLPTGNITAYPNPFQSGIRIDISEKLSLRPTEMVVTDTRGIPVYRTTVQPQATSIWFQGSTLKQGVYMVQFRNGGSLIETIKIVKM